VSIRLTAYSQWARGNFLLHFGSHHLSKKREHYALHLAVAFDQNSTVLVDLFDYPLPCPDSITDDLRPGLNTKLISQTI
jgi:hypothetical protein